MAGLIILLASVVPYIPHRLRIKFSSRPIIPATMRISYKKLFGFVSVAGLLSDSQCKRIVNSAINIAENLENVDLNTITKRTRAFIKDGTNLPSSGGSWWLLEVEYFRNQLYVVQRVYAYSSIGTSYQRVLRDGVWSSWVQLT